jgi:hypothetical protein
MLTHEMTMARAAEHQQHLRQEAGVERRLRQMHQEELDPFVARPRDREWWLAVWAPLAAMARRVRKTALWF